MRQADIVLFSNAIFDSVKDEPFAGGVVVTGERIEFVGAKEVAGRYIGPTTQVFDFGDRLIMPGFCDAHIHLEGASNRFFAPKVHLEGATSEEECVQRILQFHKENPDVPRLVGQGWCASEWGANAKLPDKHSLDPVFPDIPVYMTSIDGHMSWVNSAGIEECNMEQYIIDNPPPIVVPECTPRDPDGTLTGLFGERASTYVLFNFVMGVTREEFALYYRQLLDLCSENGITGFTDASFKPAETIAAFYAPVKALENAGRLNVRIHMYPGFRAIYMKDMAATEAILPYMDLYNTDMLHISGIKSQLDGVPENCTAAMLQPYAKDPSTKGKPITEPENVNKWMVKLNAMGLSAKLHCIGDYAVKMALDACEASCKVNDMTGIRNSIEHMEIVADEDVPRFAETGAIASFQPAHLMLSKGREAEMYGEDVVRRVHRWRELLDAGAHYALATDSPVVEVNPFYTIYNAVTRLDLDGTQYHPESEWQKLTLPEALKGYTVCSNYSSNFEGKCGTLEADKYADIVVWDKNPFVIAPTEIKDCCAVMTICNGRIVYQRK